MTTEPAAFRPAYLAAPFAPWEGETTDPGRWFRLRVEDNLRRVRQLAAHAFRHEDGIAPVYIHEAIALGVYGNDENPEERERGLQAAALIAESIAVAGGELWLLELPNGELSHGTKHEAEAFLRAAKRAGLVATVRRFKALSCYPDGVICLGIEHFAADHALGEPEADPVDDFGGIHCPACRTVHAEAVCPTCGRRAVREAPFAFKVTIESVKFSIYAADGSKATHEGPLSSVKEIVARYAEQAKP